MYRTKTKVIIGMMITIVIMGIGYAILSTNLNIQGTGNLTGSWGIRINSVESTPTGRAYNISEPRYSNTTMKFNVGVKEPGDKMTFTITVQNYGTIDAILNNIDISNSGSYVIKYGIEGIQEGTRLLRGESITFRITTEFDIEAVTIPEDAIKELTVTLNYIQDDGQSITPNEPAIEDKTLVANILKDNVVQSDSNIDFSKTSEEDGTKGLYYTNINTEDNKITYYFRGAVENNYVSFAGYYWRIVRINEDSSIRLIYQGETPNATGSDATIGNSAFNSNEDDNAYVGYMYGTPGSSSYSVTHANTNDSTIKTVIDTWYEDNLIDYSSYLADSGFCGDRSMANNSNVWNSNDTALGYGNNYTNYGAYNRTQNENQPQYSCPQQNDLFTVTNTKGNQALDYPIGLITIDEIMYAGGVVLTENRSYYLNTGSYYRAMTPDSFYNFACVSAVDHHGTTGCMHGSYKIGIRPVINLVSGIEVISGDGTSSKPYVITIN